MPERRANVPLIAAAVATVVCTALAAGHHHGLTVPGLDGAERDSVDARFDWRGARKPLDDRIVVVGIDDDTHDRHPELIQTRRGWATFLDALHGYGPSIIALDLFFASHEIVLPPPLAQRVRDAYANLHGATDPAAVQARDVLGDVVEELRGDELVAAAVARTGNVFLGMFLDTDVDGELDETPAMAPARFAESAVAAGDDQPKRAGGVSVSLPEIAAGAQGAGHTDVIPDPDAVVRRMPMVIQVGDHHYLPLALAVTLAVEGRRDSSYLGGSDHVSAGGHTYPLGPGASGLLDFVGPHDAFPHVSAADILDGTAPRDALAGKIVFVGFTYGAYDKVATPFDPLDDGVDLHATLAENLLHDRLMRPGGRATSLLGLFLLGGVVTLLQLRRIRRRTWIPATAATALMLAWCGFVYARFSAGVVVEAVAPLAGTAVVTVTALVAGLATEGREKMRLRAAFSQYVSSTLVERVLASPLRLGGERRDLTVMFSDIRGFSRLAESLDPETLASFLNEYLTPMTRIVLDSSGTLDKYIGDAVMAIWGAPLDVTDHAERACEAGLAMLARLDEMNARWRAAGRPSIAIGIGLNTGAMAVGNMGSDARFDYTVLGDAVNLASRLEGLTKEYGLDVLCGETTARAAAGRFAFREIDWVRVKGRDGTAAVFELLGKKGAARFDDADLAAWADGLAAYRARDFDRAVERWGDLALRHPDDGAAQVMRARAEHLRADPPPADWDGVYEQRSK